MERLRMSALQFILLILTFKASEAFAAGGHSDGVPLTSILWQLANVVILFTGIFFIARKSIVDSFAKRRTDYLEASKKSQALKLAAENELKSVLENLSKLKATSDESIRRAQAEAADLKNNIVKEANDLSARIRKEAADAAQVEVRKAKKELTLSFLNESFEGAENQMKNLNSNDRTKLQTQFVENMKVGEL